ncbi:MAG: MBL fold metallo-hydrolase, partial [bacterium]|nr:MBL fold metallo-hydrolase [bacterium]
MKFFSKKMCYYLTVFILASGFLTGPNALAGSNKTSRQPDEKNFLKKYKAAHRYFLKGENLFLKGKYPASQKKLEKGLEIMPRHPQSHFYLAQIYYYSKAYPQALDHIQQSKTDFEFVASLVKRQNMQNAQKLKKQKNDLDAYYLEVQCALSSNSACGSRQLGGIAGKSAEIDGKLNRSLVSGPRLPADYFYVHGNILFKLKQYPGAREQYRSTIAADPNHAGAYNNLANLYYLGKKYSKALFCLQEAENNGVSTNSRLKEMILKTGTPPGKNSRTAGIMRFNVAVGEKGSSTENTYVVFHKESKDAVIIDPGNRDRRIDEFIKASGLTIKKILNTHGHYDHIGGNHYYAGLYGAKITAHEADGPFYTGKNLENKPHEFFGDGDHTLRCGGLTATIFHTPGHSPGSV